MSLPTSSDPAASFHDALFLAKDRAWSLGVASDRSFDLAGYHVSCHFADSAMPGLILPALAHHPAANSERSGLDVYVWDGKASGVTVPDAPWATSKDNAWQCDTPRYFGLYLPTLNSLLWLDRELNRAIYWTPDASQMPIAERGSPLLLLWGAWLSGLGVHLVHAAAVSGIRGAALLLGPSGSGKSTTALSCLDSPLQYLGDDYCLIRADPEPTVFSLYCSGKIHRGDRDFHPHLEPAYAGENEEKILYQAVPTLQLKLAQRAKIVALFAVTVGEVESPRIERISAMQALTAVAPNTVLQLRVGIDSRHTLKSISAIAQQTPCYSLYLGLDRKENVNLLTEFLAR